MPVSKEDAEHALWAREIADHFADRADAAAITCDPEKVPEIRGMESGFRQMSAFFDRMMQAAEFDPSESTDAERTAGASVWEAAAALIESGTPPEEFVRLARENAAELRRSASSNDADLTV